MSELPSYCHALLAAKSGTTLTFAEIAKSIEKPEVWTTALFFGQARCDAETAKKVVDLLKLGVTNSYVWGSDPQQRNITDEMVVDGLAGKGAGSMGVSGMVVRGGTWDGPPKVSLIFDSMSPAGTCLTLVGPSLVPTVRSLGRLRLELQGFDPGEGEPTPTSVYEQQLIVVW